MRKIAIFYLVLEAWDKANFPKLCPEPITPGEYRFLRSVEGPQAAEMDLDDIYAGLQNVDTLAVLHRQGKPDRSMVIGDVVLVSDAEGVYDGYRVDSVGFVDLDLEMTQALAARWINKKEG